MSTFDRRLLQENLLLRSLSRESLERLVPNLTECKFKTGEILYEYDDEVDQVYFPLSGSMVSVLSVTEDGNSVEVGVVGGEGVIGISALLNGSSSTHQMLVQISGTGLCIKSSVLRREFQRDQNLQGVLLKYVQFMMGQISQTALCNRLHSADQRLARWLLISQDRVQTNGYVPLTHELLSRMLGTRRSTVSLTAAVLQKAGLIRYHRGKVQILDRKGLESAACGCYRVVKKQFNYLVNSEKQR